MRPSDATTWTTGTVPKVLAGMTSAATPWQSIKFSGWPPSGAVRLSDFARREIETPVGMGAGVIVDRGAVCGERRQCAWADRGIERVGVRRDRVHLAPDVVDARPPEMQEVGRKQRWIAAVRRLPVVAHEGVGPLRPDQETGQDPALAIDVAARVRGGLHHRLLPGDDVFERGSLSGVAADCGRAPFGYERDRKRPRRQHGQVGVHELVLVGEKARRDLEPVPVSQPYSE